MAKKKGKSKKDGEPAWARKMSNRKYEDQLEELQGELVKLQLWVQETGARGIVVFEGRDAAGKGGAIKRITQGSYDDEASIAGRKLIPNVT